MTTANVSTTTKDEIAAIRAMVEALEPLSPDAKLRALAFVISKTFDVGRHPMSDTLYAEARKLAHPESA